MMDITQELTIELVRILKNNAPVRDGIKYPGRRGDSPYPGNLKENGIKPVYEGNRMYIDIGGADAPYAPYTELRSRKKNWQKKSFAEFIDRCRNYGNVRSGQ